MPTATNLELDYIAAAESILNQLKNERDRQIVAQRFALGLDKRQTLEKIGSDFNITRERVRQIEKAATNKLKQSSTAELKQIDELLRNELRSRGHITLIDDVAKLIGADSDSQKSYINFLATLAPTIEVIEDGDHYHHALAVLPDFDKKTINQIVEDIVAQLKKNGKPMPVDTIHAKAAPNLERETVEQIARISKKLAHLDGLWGLSHWPNVNPKSIRDKTYLVLAKSNQPLHFSDIAKQISSMGQKKRDVTVQAVHNELIKDPRFVLVGRGIYALSEWGYTPGTVADIITEILSKESPLHKDEIVKRVLKKRQVKTTTIVLNLQEKDQFIRVSKATYALR